MEKIIEILTFFGLTADNISFEKINSGHINSTYRIIYSDNESYILQRINGNIFKKSEEIMSNIKRVTSCLRGHMNCPEFMEYDNRNYIMSEGEMWRIYPYIKNSVSYISINDKSGIYEFGRITGHFHSITEKLDIKDFYNILENFHNTSYIIKKLLLLRNSTYSTKFDFFENMLEYAQYLSDKKLPLCVTHNDVKCSNVLFDKTTGKAITLIDFDTVMPGLAVYDFGDGVRSACITGNCLDMDKFRNYCKGYFSFMKPCDPENYFLGTLCITAELAARYFTDFLENGSYFADKTNLQKLQRTEELIETAQSIIDKKSEMLEIIKEFL